jgi:hypothetical protein
MQTRLVGVELRLTRHLQAIGVGSDQGAS